MATVRSKELFLFNGERWIQKVVFSLKDNMFHIPMPMSYNIAFGKPTGQSPTTAKLEVKGKTVAEADKEFEAAIQRWKDLDTKERKVIAYCFYINSLRKVLRIPSWKTRYKNHGDEDKELLLEREDISQYEGATVGMTFNFESCIESTVGGKKFYYTYDKNENYDPKSKDPEYSNEYVRNEAKMAGKAEDPKHWEEGTEHVIIVDWSQEREDFLTKLRDRLQKLVDQAMAFEKMTQDQKGLDSVIHKMLKGEFMMALPPAEETKHAKS